MRKVLHRVGQFLPRLSVHHEQLIVRARRHGRLTGLLVEVTLKIYIIIENKQAKNVNGQLNSLIIQNKVKFKKNQRRNKWENEKKKRANLGESLLDIADLCALPPVILLRRFTHVLKIVS